MKQGDLIKIIYDENIVLVKITKIFKQYGFDNHGEIMVSMVRVNSRLNLWENELTINPEINSSILEVTLEQLKNVEDLLDTDKELIPSIIAFLK